MKYVLERILLITLSLLTAAACSDSTDPRSAGIHVVTGAERSDTTMAIRIFMIEVRDKKGKPAANTEVMFTLDPTPPMELGVVPLNPLYICRITDWVCAFFEDHGYSVRMTDRASTDDDGLVLLKMQFGPIRGTTKLTIHVPDLNMTKTLSYTTVSAH